MIVVSSFCISSTCNSCVVFSSALAGSVFGCGMLCAGLGCGQFCGEGYGHGVAPGGCCRAAMDFQGVAMDLQGVAREVLATGFARVVGMHRVGAWTLDPSWFQSAWVQALARSGWDQRKCARESPSCSCLMPVFAWAMETLNSLAPSSIIRPRGPR